MIFFGWGSKSLPLGETGVKSCGRCGDFRTFRALVNYSYFRLYFIFGVVTRKRYIVACNACGQGALMDKPTAESMFPENPIPFMERWGLAVFCLGVLTVVAAVSIR